MRLLVLVFTILLLVAKSYGWESNECVRSMSLRDVPQQLNQMIAQYEEAKKTSATARLDISFSQLVEGYDLGQLSPRFTGVFGFGPKDSTLFQRSDVIAVAFSGYGADFSRATSLVPLVALAQASGPLHVSGDFGGSSSVLKIKENRLRMGLRDGFPVIAVDIPGIGYTRRPLSEVSNREKYRAFVEELIDGIRHKYGTSKKIILIARSASGILGSLVKNYDAALLISPMIPDRLAPGTRLSVNRERLLKEAREGAATFKVVPEIMDWLYGIHNYHGGLDEFVQEAAFLRPEFKGSSKRVWIYAGGKDSIQVPPEEVEIWRSWSDANPSQIDLYFSPKGEHDPFGFGRNTKTDAPYLLNLIDLYRANL